MRGPNDSRSVLRLPQQQRAFFLGKSALGADQDVDPLCRGQPCCSASMGLPMSAASSQNTSRRLVSRFSRKRSNATGSATVGKAQDAALLGGLDDIGAHPLNVDPRTWVCRVNTGCSAEAPISTAFCTM